MKKIMSVLLSAALAFSLICPAYAAFTDVSENHWAAADIQYAAERGLFNGTSDTTFAPNANMSRAMLATVLYRYAGSPAVVHRRRDLGLSKRDFLRGHAEREAAYPN